MSFLKPKPATASSDNANNGLITSAYAPQMTVGNNASNFLGDLLGTTGSHVAGVANSIGQGANAIATAGGAQAGYDNYLQNAGFAPAMKQLSQDVTGQGAAAGILNSGTTARTLQDRGTALNHQFFDNYLQHLNQAAQTGIQAGGLVANAGQRSSNIGGSPSTLGSIASTVGGITSIFSDRRLKHSVEKIGEEADGLGIYRYSYLGQAARLVGVMADEVAKLRPWALGRKIAGYSTVNYGAL